MIRSYVITITRTGVENHTLVECADYECRRTAAFCVQHHLFFEDYIKRGTSEIHCCEHHLAEVLQGHAMAVTGSEGLITQT